MDISIISSKNQKKIGFFSSSRVYYLKKYGFLHMEKVYSYLEKSLQRAIAQAGNMRKLAEDRGMDYSTINRFNSGDNAIENMPLKTMVKIFPELQIFCFRTDLPADVQPPTVRDSDILEELNEVVTHLSPRDKVKLLSLVVRFDEKTKEESGKND